MTQYDFAALYGQADNSSLLYDEAWHPSVIEAAEFGRTKDGTKGQWTVRHRIAAGPNAGKMPLTGYVTVATVDPSAPEEEQAKQRRNVGRMFRQLASLGIPVPDPKNPAVVVNGQVPFWMMGWSEEQVAAAMVGQRSRIRIKHDEWGDITRNKIADWAAPQPNDPADWPRDAAPSQQQQGFAQPPAGYGQQAQPSAWGQQPQQAPQGWQQPQAQQPVYGQQQQGVPPMQDPARPQFPGQVVPQGQDYTAQPQQPQQGVPGAPPWAQPPTPGQGGVQEFTQQGMSQHPAYQQPPAQGQPMAAPQQWQPAAQNGQQAPQQWGQAPQQAAPQQAIPQPPWSQQAAQQPQAQPQQPAGPEAPPPPPWAQ